MFTRSHGHFSHPLTLYTRTTALGSQTGDYLSASFKLFIYNYDELVHIINQNIPFRNSALKSKDIFIEKRIQSINIKITVKVLEF